MCIYTYIVIYIYVYIYISIDFVSFITTVPGDYHYCNTIGYYNWNIVGHDIGSGSIVTTMMVNHAS